MNLRPEWRNLLIIFLTAILTSCTYTFELKDSHLKSMAAVRAKICADSTVVIHVDKTVPLTQIGNVDTTLVSPHYSLLCNGKEVETTFEMDGMGGMVIKSDSFKNGDRLEFTFSTDDMETATAVTEIPQQFPKYTISMATSNKVRIVYEDDPQKNNYYAAIVQWCGTVLTYDNEGSLIPYKFVEDGSVYLPVDLEAIDLDPGAYSPTVTKHDGRYIYFWSDKDEEDNVYELIFNYQYAADSIMDRKVRCLLFTLSEEMYRTMFAEYDSNYNPLAYLGLSSPSYTYSNIRNGLGHFCGYSVTPSEWIDAPVQKEL